MYDIIYNPTSGEGKAQKAFDKVTAILSSKNLEFTPHATKGKKDATAITTELNGKQAFTNLIVIGGDGTFNEVLNGITNFSTIALGLIPAGTGNDYCKAKGIPGNTAQAVENIIYGKPQFTDYIDCQNKRALNVVGAGMDTDVLVRYANMKFLRGKIKYYAAVLYVACHLNFHKVTIKVNGETRTTKVFLVAVANGNFIGGGMPVAPHAKTDDGFLEVVVVSEIPHYKVFGLLIKFLTGKITKQACCECFHTKSVNIVVEDDGKTQIDGEVQESQTLDCSVVTNQLMLFSRK